MSTPNHYSIQNLPPEVLLKLFNKLKLSSENKYQDLVSCQSVCTNWRAILTGSESVNWLFEQVNSQTLIKYRIIIEQILKSYFGFRFFRWFTHISLGLTYWIFDSSLNPGAMMLTTSGIRCPAIFAKRCTSQAQPTLSTFWTTTSPQWEIHL